MDETLFWLELAQESKLVSEADAESVVREGNALLSIVVSSIQTARDNS